MGGLKLNAGNDGAVFFVHSASCFMYRAAGFNNDWLIYFIMYNLESHFLSMMLCVLHKTEQI